MSVFSGGRGSMLHKPCPQRQPVACLRTRPGPEAPTTAARGTEVLLAARQRACELADQGFTCSKGPSRSGKLLVLSTCTPALCSPLNGVVFPEQPAFVASCDELNHSPRWKVWMGPVAGLDVASGKAL